MKALQRNNPPCIVDAETLQRAAMTWTGTPFARLHGTKSIAADCGNVVYGVLRDAGAPLPELNAPTFGFSHDMPYSGQMDSFLKQIPNLQALEDLDDLDLQPGDLILYRLSARMQHLVLAIGGGFIIQTWPRRRCEITAIDTRMNKKILGHYRLTNG